MEPHQNPNLPSWGTCSFTVPKNTVAELCIEAYVRRA